MDLSLFLKSNKILRENKKYKATKSLIDPKTKQPLEWEIKPLTTKENEKIRNECLSFKNGKPILDSAKYLAKLVVSTVVYPDLYDSELQDSYGVKTPEDLLKEILDDPTEFNALGEFIQDDMNKISMSDKVKTAKN